MPPRRFHFSLWLILALWPAGQSLAQEPESAMPEFDLEEVPVIHSETRFRPKFSKEVTTFSFYEQPELPRGELILALEFMDRYRDSPIPGSFKWAGLLHFPVIDGREQTYLKYICLYFYDDRMFGYDPTARYDSERRFAVPIQYEDRMNDEVLFRFARSYVESIFPADQDIFYMDEYYDPEDPSMGYEQTMEFIDIPEGRIAPVLPSQKGKQPEELVQLVYLFSMSPNLDAGTAKALGPGEDFTRWPEYSWSAFWDAVTAAPPDPITTARSLVAPRWSRIAEYRYPKKILLLWEIEAHKRVLLFNIGEKVYAYHPRFGVWRTGAMLADVEGDGKNLSGMLRYPGIKVLPEIVFLEDPPDPPLDDGQD